MDRNDRHLILMRNPSCIAAKRRQHNRKAGEDDRPLPYGPATTVESAIPNICFPQ